MGVNGHFSVPGPDNIHRVELENGIVLLVYENPHVQSVVMSGSLAGGSIFDTPEQNGLASMTASALMQGTITRDFDAIYGSLEDIGADVSIGARVHRTGFGGKALAEDLPTLIDILSNSLRNPTFPEAHVQRMRGERLTWLQYSQQDTRYQAGRAFRRSLYPVSHPYHYATWGTQETLPRLTVSDLQDFHQRYYGPRGMIIAIVGAVKAEDAVQIVRDHFADWQNPDQPTPPPLPSLDPLEESRTEFVPVPGKTQSDIVMGVYGPSRFDEDYMAATLANSVLGEFGMMGRLGHVIREQLGLAYYAYSRIEGGYGPAPWAVLAGVAPENISLTIDRALEQLRHLVEQPVSDEDLADIQSYYTGRLPLRLESSEGIAVNLHGMESYGLGLDYLETYRDRIYSLTQADLLAAARRYLNPDAAVVAVAGPED